VYFLNLSVLQFVAVFGSIAAFAVALYLLDRSRRRQVVSTLRFWVSAQQPAVAARRRRIQQPWSLILQLVSMALILLAVAELRLGSPAAAGRDHVIILESSAWMAAKSGNRTLMDVARDRALRYLQALPSRDRVMLVRADGLATPATAFEPDRRKIEAAIYATEPGSTSLNLDEALAFARHAQSQAGGRAGEITFIGTGRTVEGDPAGAVGVIPRLRVLPVADAIENAGLRKVGARRSAANPDVWEIYVSARNYGTRPRAATVSIDFGPGGSSARSGAGSVHVMLPPGGEKDVSFEHRTSGAGVLGVTLEPHDAFPADDHAELELPAQPSLPVTVYSNEPELLRPILSSSPRVTAVYRKPDEYRAADQGLVILDRFIPPQRPTCDSIWIDPPAQGSPIPVRETVTAESLRDWNPDHPVAFGLRARDFKLDKASVFEAGADDGRVAEVSQGPVIVTRSGNPKIAVLGFHPALTGMRYELSTPLLFANLLRWMSPEIFRRWEISVGSVGSVKLLMDDDSGAGDTGTKNSQVKVLAADGSALPFTLRDRVLHFFSGSPGAVRVLAGDREYVYSLTLPELWDTKWQPPAGALKGIPHFAAVGDNFFELWPWLALLGAVGLLAEWLLYGRFRRGGRARGRAVRQLSIRNRKSVPAAGVRK
jgi:hypothetical protein